jgi:membrane protein required for colicin V production
MDGFAVEVDIALVLLLAGGFLLGLFRGAVRQLIGVGAWLVTFIVAAYLHTAIGDWIAQQPNGYSRDYVDMLGFLAAFIVLFGVAMLIIEIGGSTIHLTSRIVVDEILGGLLGLGLTILTLGSVIIILDTYYAANPPIGAAELDLVRGLHQGLERSAIAQALHDSLVPGLLALLGPLLPAEIRSPGA